MSDAGPDRAAARTRAVILAGGGGTRVRQLLPGLPKPMAPVAGRPFVEWVVRFFARHGVGDFTLATGHLAGVVAAHFATQPVPDVTVACCAEPVPLGTAGGFLHCAATDRSAGTLWLVANGDSLIFADPGPLIEIVRSGRAAAAILGLALEDAGRYGTLDIGPDGRLRAFIEKRPGAGVVNSGVYAFSSEVVRTWPARRPLSLETEVFPVLAVRGEVAVQRVSAPFLDIGTPESLAQADAFIRKNQAGLLP